MDEAAFAEGTDPGFRAIDPHGARRVADAVASLDRVPSGRDHPRVRG